MAEPQPNFALDLSNDGIALWYRSGGTGWSSLAKISLDDPELETKLKVMRSLAETKGHPLRAVVRVPKSEVLLSRVKLGVFEGEAAIVHALKQINKLTSYSLQEITYDIGDKSVGNMAPVAITSRTTLEEAKKFALQQGFTPVYFTTQYTNREFNRELRFYLNPPKKPLLPLISKIAAAAAIGLTAGYFGYVNLIAPDAPPQADLTTALSEPAQPHPDSETTSTPAITRPTTPEYEAQEPDFPASEVATLQPPETTGYPEFQRDNVQRFSFDRLERLARPKAGDYHEAPFVHLASAEDKTDALVLFEAERDLPDVAMTDDDVRIIQRSMALYDPPQSAPDVSLALAALTNMDGQFPDRASDILAIPSNSYALPPKAAATLPSPPPPPPAYLSATPGTLTPTPEGTLGPENILIYSGRPQKESRARPVAAPPPDPLASVRARPRPARLLSTEQIAALEAEQIAASASNIAPEVAQDLASLPETQPVDQTAGPGDVTGVTGPETPPLTDARVDQPAGLAPPAGAETAPGTQVLAALPVQPLQTPEDPDALLALADPALSGKKPRIRPLDLKIPVVPYSNSLLASADPALSGFRAKKRPANLKIPAEILETPSVPTLENATSLAVATSLAPRPRPAKIASIAAKLTLPSDTTASATTPDAAIGTSRSSPEPTKTSVVKAATEKSQFNKKKMNLVGVFGTPNDRRALVRLASGRYVKVKKGDRLSGWQVSAIGEASVRIRKGTKDQVLRMP